MFDDEDTIAPAVLFGPGSKLLASGTAQSRTANSRACKPAAKGATRDKVNIAGDPAVFFCALCRDYASRVARAVPSALIAGAVGFNVITINIKSWC